MQTNTENCFMIFKQIFSHDAAHIIIHTPTSKKFGHIGLGLSALDLSLVLLRII